MLDPSVNEKVWAFLLSGGVFMAFIAACSFVAIAVSIHRSLTLRWKSVIPPELRGDLARCDQVFESDEPAALYEMLKQSDSPIGRIGRIALSPEFTSREEAENAIEATAREQMVKLENGMGVLEVVITIAPLLGLLGTVSGLVGVFATLGERGDVADPSLIASGIAVALNTTIAGLVVAVITVIFHSYFTRRLERIAARIEVIAGHLLHEFYRAGGVALYEQESQSSAELDGILRGSSIAVETGGSEPPTTETRL
ncbi:MotA/TolQ/ExbB proton channel family protein [Verrucomicrobiales bacterium BCK34]|nr:MotA/TolQ/ExbB proton channel family protein [Verrucomicrobiales bacterium BCK34]